jgi:hypothetical protein
LSSSSCNESIVYNFKKFIAKIPKGLLYDTFLSLYLRDRYEKKYRREKLMEGNCCFCFCGGP